ncbi:MAG: hypothetical protein HYR94_05290 [Chloroflexi bacterium]|nr:hypothetical protein [Chloroflexota bacterium]
MSQSLRQSLLDKLTTYSQKAAELGLRVRQLVFGFRLRSTAHIDRWALPVVPFNVAEPATCNLQLATCNLPPFYVPRTNPQDSG